MSDTLIRRNCGAIEFVKSLGTPSNASQATVFTPGSDNCVDPGWDDILKTLQAFHSLEDDWDGSGSIAPWPEVIDCAIHVATHLKRCEHPAPDRVIAGVNGTVSFESGPKPLSEIEVVSGNRAEHYEDGQFVGEFKIQP